MRLLLDVPCHLSNPYLLDSSRHRWCRAVTRLRPRCRYQGGSASWVLEVTARQFATTHIHTSFESQESSGIDWNWLVKSSERRDIGMAQHCREGLVEPTMAQDLISLLRTMQTISCAEPTQRSDGLCRNKKIRSTCLLLLSQFQVHRRQDSLKQFTSLMR